METADNETKKTNQEGTSWQSQRKHTKMEPANKDKENTKMEPANKDKENTPRWNQLTKTKKAHQEGTS